MPRDNVMMVQKMCGGRTGVSTQILKENPKVFFVYSIGHVESGCQWYGKKVFVS